jgi:cbb3-type cytochrome oxidase subunit 3
MGRAGLSIYAEIALVLFLLVFVAVVIRIFTARRADMERRARMPLEDEPTSEKETRDG